MADFTIDYKEVERSILEKTCAIHGKKAEMEPVVDHKMKFKTCCEDFRAIVLKAAKEDLVKQTKKQISEKLKGFGK